MDYIPESMRVYRGSLTMPKGSTPDEHVKTRRNFLQILNRWKTSKNYTVEMRGLLHITDPLNGHWDVLAYSDAPESSIKATVADAWRRAGGKPDGWSLMPASDEELAATIKYQNKDTVNPDIARRYLPETEENMGMKFIWHTRPSKTSKGFWASQSEESLWQEWLTEWYGKDRGSGGKALILDNMFRLKQIARLKALTPYADDYLEAFDWYLPEAHSSSASLNAWAELVA